MTFALLGMDAYDVLWLIAILLMIQIFLMIRPWR